MRFAIRLGLGLVLAVSLVLAGYAWDRVRREITTFEDEAVRDHAAFGRALSTGAELAWRTKGKQAAIQLLEHTNAGEGHVTILWVDPNLPTGTTDSPRVPVSKRMERHGMSFSILTGQGIPELCSYTTIGAAQARHGAIEMCESLAHEKKYVRMTIWRTASAIGLVALLCGLIVIGGGVWFLGRPLQLLRDKARRVGAGDLSGRLGLRRRDEIGELAGEMDAMCEQLGLARERIERETAERIAALEQLRHADRLSTVGQLASGIAHELGTPLNVVSGRAKSIATERDTGEEALDSARIIHEQADRMAGIIRQLLDFARQRPPDRKRQDLTVIARTTAQLLAPLAAKRRVELRVEAPEAPLEVHVDGQRLQQALTNLIVNGVHAMSAGGQLTILLEKQRCKSPAEAGVDEPVDCVVVEIRDQGAGMEPAVLARVFEPFFTTKPVGEGTGLGLSVSYGIVREHGGWIEARSEPGRGSTFRIALPVGADA